MNGGRVGAGRARRIGILGGTFDPIHRGHLALAEAAARRCRLDWIYFVPAPRPMHKTPPVAAYADRYAMTALALAGRRRWSPLAVPAAAERPTYSVEQVAWIARRHPRARLYFILGADAMVEVRTWRQYRKLLAACDFVVAPRAEFGLEAVRAALPRELVGKVTGEGFRLGKRQVFWLPNFRDPAGSRQLRRRLASGRPGGAEAPIPAPVTAYLLRSGLYRS